MKSKLIISLILCFFFFQGVGMSQTAKSNKKAQAAKKSTLQEFFNQNDKQLTILDSLIKIKGTGFAAPNVAWGRAEGDYFQVFNNSRNSSLSFRKEFKEKKSVTRSYEIEYEVKHKAMNIRITMNASIGKIQIIIIKPNGKNFRVLEVEDMERLNWNHTVSSSSLENNENYAGLWKVKVIAKDAEGYYDISFKMR